MSFNPDAGNLSGMTDVGLSNVQSNQTLVYDDSSDKWTNTAITPTMVDGLQATLDTKPTTTETILVVRWTGTTWPPRPTEAPFGVMFLSTNDPSAPPPSPEDLHPGDLWRRHPGSGG